jgi:AAA family ATP:ADP antiporter
MPNVLDPKENNLSNSKTDLSPPTPPENDSKTSWLDYIWPITRSELPKFLWTTLLMFCILSIQNLVRAMKDSVVNTMIGPETVSFLKFWGVLPAAFLVTILYVKLVNTMKSEKIFYLIISFFLSFFLLFAFYLLPNYETFHLSPEKTGELVMRFPNLKWFILLLSNWSFSLFYVIAELWPNFMYALLFWQFVNSINSVDESKRFYPLFGLLGQTGLYLSGVFLKNLRSFHGFFSDLFNLNGDYNIITIQMVITIILVLGVFAFFAFWMLNHVILDVATAENLKFKTKKKTITMRESFVMISKSRYVRLIAILLICYGTTINLVEGPWKAQASKLYTTPTEFAEFVGGYLSYTGILTLCFVLLGSNIVRKFGWLAAALMMPGMMLITGGAFFVISNFSWAASFAMIYFALTDPLALAAIIGAIQNILSKSLKYTVYDATKEMAYVPLDDELKSRGKAAADMIGSKLGKSLSALLQSTIFIIFPTATYASLSMILMVVFVIVCIVWIFTVLELNKEYQAACAKHKGEEQFF